MLYEVMKRRLAYSLWLGLGSPEGQAAGQNTTLSGCEGWVVMAPAFFTGPSVSAGLWPIATTSDPLQPSTADPSLHRLVPSIYECANLFLLPSATTGRRAVMSVVISAGF